ncbi:hypothetical protein XH98_20585 [Bradyrhizobium sp. CCBAU 51745]|uniref:hypothetical protein n=1 Tax=Bradyrhizobium sp. CCBAU 51745 TaxID=1325099 RepID=UPI002306481D|nr:hypothetical protein [Bradyrhizobium sp. CCBAU 51745]MDA9441444.1 hypothetical protein [Bradyrhizobium sp. CCBAU 51745]
MGKLILRLTRSTARDLHHKSSLPVRNFSIKKGAVRTLLPALRDFAEQQILASARGAAQTFGAEYRSGEDRLARFDGG